MNSIRIILLLIFWLRFVTAQVVPGCATDSVKNNGIYKIQVNGGEAMDVYCDVSLAGSPWLVIQRRKSADINFYRNWSSYQKGFGELKSDYFIGLDKLHTLTVAEPQELYIHLEDFEGQTRFAKYDEFAIKNEASQYAMHKLGNYSGNAGDSLRNQYNMKFTTFDWDNDHNDNANCAVKFTGAWWYRRCHTSNLNGLYLGGASRADQTGRGITWYRWRGQNYSYKTVHMMIRPKKKK